MKNEIIVHKSHRIVYDQAIRMTGAKIIEIGLPKEIFLWELESAISEQTAAAVYFAHAEKDIASIPHNCPNPGIGRSMKIGKEEIIGLLVALEMYLKEDLKEREKNWMKIVEFIFDKINNLKGIKVEKKDSYDKGVRPECIPRLLIRINEQLLGISSVEVIRQLKEEDPGVIVGHFKNVLTICPYMLNKGKEEIVVQRFVKIFNR